TEIPPSFPGGEAGWQTYITKHIKSNIDNLVNDNKSGTCRVKFIVDKDGSVSAINALTMKGSVLAEVATNAIANGPKWIPAKQNGRVVKSFAEQPVTFTIQTK
ncbi:MAG: energy transducer TonB, partial [Ginsengibacter sp.]